jgi:hypothetical protein
VQHGGGCSASPDEEIGECALTLDLLDHFTDDELKLEQLHLRLRKCSTAHKEPSPIRTCNKSNESLLEGLRALLKKEGRPRAVDRVLHKMRTEVDAFKATLVTAK